MLPQVEHQHVAVLQGWKFARLAAAVAKYNLHEVLCHNAGPVGYGKAQRLLAVNEV
jgi:hypothetical protein